MAIYNRSWLHTIAHDLQAPDVYGNLWQSICKHYGITQTKNGTWLEALCDFFNVNKEDGEAWIQALAEDFGATGPVNGSWIEALALQIQQSADLIDLFLARINTDGGTFEAEVCLEQTLNTFSNMSLLDTASLIVTPNGYNAGKLDSVIPSDGSGDLSVTRATTATRVNSAGLVELVPYNLVQYSEQFDNAYWSKYQATIGANAATAPNGTLTADSITNTLSAVGSVYVSVTGLNASTTHTLSVYFKKGTYNLMFLEAGGASYNFALFDINSGTVGTISGFSNVTITNVGNGWFRCVASFSDTNSSVTIGYGTAGSPTAGDVTYLWGAQLVEGSTAKDYQKTGTRLNIPRLDYSNGTCPSLLVEPQRTNLLAYSEQFDNAGYWSTYQSSITGDTTTAPNGTQTADTLTALANTGGDAYRLINFSGTHTASCYIKAGTSNKARIGFSSGEVVFYDLSTGVVTTSGVVTGSMVDAGNGWWRCIATVNSTTIYTAFSNDGTNGQTVYLWGAQLEAGSYATSYIPTTSASVTRNADVISKTGISSLIGQTEGTIFGECLVIPQKADSMLCLLRNSSGGLYGDFFYIRASNGVPAVSVRQGDTTYVAIDGTTALSEGYHKFAFAYKQNDFAFYVDGVQIGTDTIGNVPTCNEIYLGQYADGADREVSKKSFALWKTRLTNTQLAQLTSI